MLTHKEMVGIQAEKHELVNTANFSSVEEFVLHLIHQYAYNFVSVRSVGKRVLDLGCNVGYGTKILQMKAKEVVGVDVSPNALAEAKAKFPELDFELVDGESLPFKGDSFDVVVSCQVIEHIVDHSSYIAEIQRVLKSDGEVFFTTPNSKMRLDSGMEPWNPFHVKEYSANELESVLKDYFESVTVLGLFARGDIYSIEKRRLDRSRERARHRAAIKEPLANDRSHRGCIDALKRALPAGLKAAVKRVIGRQPKVVSEQQLSPEDLQFVGRSGLDDLWYSNEKTDDALDLLAVCSGAKPIGRSSTTAGCR